MGDAYRNDLSRCPGFIGTDSLYWESAPTSEPDRIYFTAESGGRVIAGASGIGAILSNVQVASLTAWLKRVGNVKLSRTLTEEDWQ